MAEHKSYELNTDETDLIVIFSDGMLARMVRTIKEDDDFYTFYIVPTETLSTMWDLEEKQKYDPRYNNIEDFYEVKVPRTWAKPLNFHPFFQRWQIFSNWDCKKYIDPFNSERKSLIDENERLKQERNANWFKVTSLLRKQNRLSKHEGMAQEEALSSMAEVVNKLNVLAQDKGGKE